MAIEIKNRFSGNVIRTVKAETLSGADLSYANLTGASLTRVSLNDAALSHANLTNASLRNASLAGADLEGTIFSNTECPDGVNSDAAGGSCAGRRAVSGILGCCPPQDGSALVTGRQQPHQPRRNGG